MLGIAFLLLAIITSLLGISFQLSEINDTLKTNGKEKPMD